MKVLWSFIMGLCRCNRLLSAGLAIVLTCFVAMPAFAEAAAGESPVVVNVTTSDTLTYVGYTSSPLSDPVGINAVTVKVEALPQYVQDMLKLPPDQQMLFIDPQDQGYFWFKGDVRHDAITVIISDENGWSSQARDSGGGGGYSCYSVDNIPANSQKFTVHIGHGLRWDWKKPFKEFVAWDGSQAADDGQPDKGAKTELPIVLKSGDYRMTVHRVMSGMPELIDSRRKENLREDDYLNGQLKQTKLTEMPYTGIVYELEKKAAPGSGGLLSSLFGDGYYPANNWTAWANVKDSDGTTWSTSFRGNRGGWGKIQYMETYVDLPDNQGPFQFNMYFTKMQAHSSPDVVLKDWNIPEEGGRVDEITTTTNGKHLTIGMVGKFTDLDSKFLMGQFEVPAIYVSSPEPIPGIQISVRTDKGAVDDSGDWTIETSDKLHYLVFSFGRDGGAKDPFQPDVPVTVSISLPETLHFEFDAVPERPE